MEKESFIRAENLAKTANYVKKVVALDIQIHHLAIWKEALRKERKQLIEKAKELIKETDDVDIAKVLVKSSWEEWMVFQELCEIERWAKIQLIIGESLEH